MKRIFSLWGPPVVWMSIIFLLSNRQRVSVSSEYVLNFLFFKTLHVLEYAMLFFLHARALGVRYAKHRYGRALVAIALTILYAASDEIHQTFVPTREGKVRDVIIDAVGTLAAWYTIIHILPKAPKKLRSWAKRLELL